MKKILIALAGLVALAFGSGAFATCVTTPGNPQQGVDSQSGLTCWVALPPGSFALPPGAVTSVGGTVLGNTDFGMEYNKNLSSNTNTIPLGVAVSQFAGLQFALAQNGLGVPTGTMTGYVAGDNITLSCTGVTFATAPVITASYVSGGAVTSAVVSNPGITSGVVTSGAVSCSQASTTGSGTGLNVTGVLGVIASYIYSGSLYSGGGGDGSLMIAGDPTSNYWPSMGVEDTIFGNKAGSGLQGLSQYDAVVGHNALGSGGSGATSSFDVAVGDDTGRNIQGSASNGYITLVGAGAGRNAANGYITCVGGIACGSGSTNTPGALSGANTSAFGYDAGGGLTSGSGNTLLGAKAGTAITSGYGNIVLQATTSNDACSGLGNTTENFIVCMDGGIVQITVGGGTPSTSQTNFEGTVGTNGYAIASLPSCGTNTKGVFTYVTNGVTSPTYLGTVSTTGSTVAPVFCNGTNWIYH